MTPLTGARKRAEELAAAVDGRRPAESLRPEVAELVDVVSTLRSAPAPAPRPEFSASLRERLVAEARESLATQAVLTLPQRRRGARERRLVAAASAFVLVGGTAGMAAAAQDALPGDALYPLKRGIERAEADLRSGDGAKGRQLLDQAAQRLVEAEALLGSSRAAQFPETVATFTAQAQQGAELLLTAYEDGGDSAAVAELRGFAVDSLTDLQDMARTAPAGGQDELTDAALVLQRIDQAAAGLCSSCSDLPALQMPPLFLTAADASRALAAVEGAELDNAHPLLTEQRGEAAPPQSPAQPQQQPPAQPPQPDQDTPPGSPVPPGGLDVEGPKSPQEAVKKTKELVDGVLDGVKGLTKPILPDPVDPLLDTLLPTQEADGTTAP